MTIAFDAASAIQALTSSPLTYSHTPSGTPAGIIVLGLNRNVAADEITSVTYGGTAMTEVSPSPIVGNTQVIYIYFLNAPSAGAQDVVITPSGSNGKRFMSISVTSATGQSQVIDADGTTFASQDDPSLTMNCGSTTCFIASVIHSFLLAVSDITEPGTFTSIEERDDGSDICGFARLTTPASGDIASGWTTTSAAACAVGAIAIAELTTAPATRRLQTTVSPRRW